MSPCACFGQGDLPDLIAGLKSFRYGQTAAPLDTLTARVAEARGNPDRRREIAKALASVLQTDSAFEAKQYACRQLVFVAGDEEVPALAALLADGSLAHYALMPLARLHTKAASDALLTALPGAAATTEIEILDTLADLGDVRAIAPAIERLKAGGPPIREGAAAALAKLATIPAVDALRTAFTTATGPQRAIFGDALITAASRLRAKGETIRATEIYDLIAENQSADPSSNLASAALRGLAEVRGEKALPALLRALGEQGTRRQASAATLLREMQGRALVDALAKSVSTLQGKAQLLAIDILGDKADPAAAAAIATLCRNTDTEVRQAAMRAAGSVGDVSLVPLLLNAAASGAGDERSVARDSLVRIKGAAADRALLSAMDTGTPPVQVQAIQALAQRGAIGITPRLLKAARSAYIDVSAAALRVLRDQAPASALPALVDLLTTLPADQRDEDVEAVAQVIRRHPDDRMGLPLLLERLHGALKPADRVTLVRAIGQVGGKGALEALRRATTEPVPAIQAAALSALAEWPTDEPMGDLLRVARSSSDSTQRAVALRGYLRMAAGSDQRSPAEEFALYKEVAAIATRPEEKRLTLAGLTRIPSLDALQYAVSLTADKAVRPEAELAVAEIGRATIGAWPKETIAALEPIARAGINEDARKRAEATLAVSRKFGDFIVCWEVSPAYQQDGADYIKLFELPFPPEQAESDKVPWRPLAVGGTPDQPWLLDLLAQWPGEQKVAYLRTAVWCDAAKDLRLEIGSDDGLKVWWNGDLAFSHNIARAVAPAEEKATVHAKQGWNRLLLKVTQNNQGWGACVRPTNLDGSPASGLRFALPSAVK